MANIATSIVAITLGTIPFDPDLMWAFSVRHALDSKRRWAATSYQQLKMAVCVPDHTMAGFDVTAVGNEDHIRNGAKLETLRAVAIRLEWIARRS
jgi:hypothetical protein